MDPSSFGGGGNWNMLSNQDALFLQPHDLLNLQQQQQQQQQMFQQFQPSQLQQPPPQLQQFQPQASPQQFQPQASPQQFQPQASPQQFQPQASPQQFQSLASPQQFQPQASPQQFQPHASPQQFQQQPPPQQFQQQQLLIQQQQPPPPPHPQPQQEQQSLASHFDLLNLIEKLADAIENGARDQHFDALVSELTSQFEKCQQLLNTIAGSLSSKNVTVECQKRKLEETEQLLNQQRELMSSYRKSLEGLIRPEP